MKTPRDLQRQPIKECLDRLAIGGSNALLVSATGTGKTFMMMEVIKGLLAKKPDARFLVLIHSQFIHKGLTETFEEQLPGMPYSLMTQKDKMAEGQIIFGMMTCTYNQLVKRDDRMGTFDYLIIDECHRSECDTYKSICRVLLNRNQNLSTFGCTATVRRSDDKPLDNLFVQDDVIVGISYEEGIGAGFLAPVDVRAVVLKEHEKDIFYLADQMANHQIRQAEFNKKDEAVFLSTSTNKAVYEGWLAYGADRQTLFNATSIRHAEVFNALLKEKGVDCAIVHSEMDRQTVAETLAQYEEGRLQCLINIQMLGEGVDMPAISCVVLMGAYSHLSRVQQNIGRGSRLIEGTSFRGVPKTDLLVLDFGQSVTKHKGNLLRLQTVLVKPENTVRCVACEHRFSSKLQFCPECKVERYRLPVMPMPLSALPGSPTEGEFDDVVLVSADMNALSAAERSYDVTEFMKDKLPGKKDARPNAKGRVHDPRALMQVSPYLEPFIELKTTHQFMALDHTPVLIAKALQVTVDFETEKESYHHFTAVIVPLAGKRKLVGQSTIDFLLANPDGYYGYIFEGKGAATITINGTLESVIERLEILLTDEYGCTGYQRKNARNKTFTKEVSDKQWAFLASQTDRYASEYSMTSYEASCLISHALIDPYISHIVSPFPPDKRKRQ